MTAVSGISGSGKSSLVTQTLVELVSAHLGHETGEASEDPSMPGLEARAISGGRIATGAERLSRLILVDQKPIGRTPRSNLATYTGLFDSVRKLFAGTRMARHAAMTPAASPSTSPRGAAPTAKAKDS